MAQLVEEVQADTKKNGQYVISLQSLKNLEQIEKLSRAIRQRMELY
jgi:cell division septation protein DedD